MAFDLLTFDLMNCWPQQQEWDAGEYMEVTNNIL